MLKVMRSGTSVTPGVTLANDQSSEPLCVSWTGHDGVFARRAANDSAEHPLRMRPLPSMARTEHIHGPVLLVNCWRQYRHRTNPSHLMHGLGSLIAAAVIKDVVPRNITTVLLHQCPAIEHWPLAAAIWKMVRAAALEQQLFTASTRVLTLSPVDRNVSFASVPGRFLCARELFVQKQAGYWLECRQPILTLWRAHLDGWLAAHRLAADKRPTRAVVWQRPEVQEGGASAYWAPRRIVNIDRVIQLFEPPAVVVSASEKMSAVQQVALFRSFGVVISIHGSHLTGLLFAPPHIVAVEVQSVLSDLTFFKNGQCLVRRYVLSVGHTPQHPLTCDISRSRNVIEFERSKEGARSMRCRLKHKNANLVVNATILRRDLGLSCSMCRYRTGAA